MKWFLWTVSLGCVSLGALLFVASAVLIANPKASSSDRDASAGLFILATPPMIAGGAIAWALYFQQRNANRRQQTEQAQQLQKLFYDLVQQQQGRLTVLQFAAATGLSGPEAKAYLDERAKEFGADFEVESAGEIAYKFPV